MADAQGSEQDPGDSGGEQEWYDKAQAKAEYDAFYADGDFVRFPVSDSRFIGALLARYGIREGASVLDVACGTGKFTKYFFDHGTEPVGIDISQEGVLTAAEKYPAVDFLLGDAMALPFGEGQFDVIFCHGFPLFNEPDLEAARPYMTETASYLDPDGVFVFGKTSSLTDEVSEGETRMDHSIETFVEFFSDLDDYAIREVAATVPPAFVPLGRFGFSRPVTRVSTAIARTFGLPLRVYIVLERSEIPGANT